MADHSFQNVREGADQTFHVRQILLAAFRPRTHTDREKLRDSLALAIVAPS
jgi:hypothetical protein